MIFRRLSAGSICLLFAACASTKVEEGFYSAKHSKYRIEVDKQGRKQGKETWWHPNGKLKYEAVNRQGIRDGRFTAWDSNGVKWYEGYEHHGKPESTLTYWYPNGQMKSQVLYRDGIQLERKDWDENGRFIAPRAAGRPSPQDAESAPEADADGSALTREAAARQSALQLWAMRVRQTVESYWSLPRELAGKPLKAVAKIKVGREGRILNVAWVSKSPNASFNTLAQQTFKKIKRMPPFPPQVKDESLEIQYEFVSQGRAGPRRRLEARGSGETAPEE
jgi:hypothetical protein